MGFTSTTEPTYYGAIGASGNDSWIPRIVFSYAVASTVSIAKGDFIKLASSTTNSITKCNSSADGASFIGIALGALDNSSGTTASDTKVPVLREGIAMVDILVASASGTQNATVNFDDILYLADTDTNMAYRGQAFTGTANGQPVARSIDKIDRPTASTIFKGRVYINTLLKATPVQ